MAVSQKFISTSWKSLQIWT